MERTTETTGRARAGARGLLGLVALLALSVTACQDAGRTEYSIDGDTGAAAPATTLDQNTAKMQGPDSTDGVGGRTGEPGVAGTGASVRDTSAATTPPPQ